jgi:hypothetical protein
MRAVISFLVLAVGTLTAVTLPGAVEQDHDAAPFGLEWGMSSTHVRALGVEIKDSPLKDYGSSYAATKLPKVIADIDAVVLSFGFDDKLWRIAAVSKPFANDPYGSAVRKRYDELASELAEKYGSGEQHHQLGQGFYGKADTFVYALQTGNAWYYTNYTTSLVKIQISIRASEPSTGFYQITFENSPLQTDFEKSKKVREKGSL